MPPESRNEGPPVLPGLAGTDELEVWGEELGAGEQHSLVDLVNRVLDKGVVITGDVTISVAGVDLVYLGLNAILTSVSTARRIVHPGLGAGARPEE